MAKEKEIDLNQPITLTTGEMMQLFATFQQNAASAAEQQNKALVEGLKQLSPHYVAPGQEENIKQGREAQRKIEIFKIKNLRRRQKDCEHEVGQNGRKRLGEGAFCGLRLCTGETIGVCQYCQKIISSANPEHQIFFRKINGEVASSNQITGLIDPQKAQLARLGEDERIHVLAVRAKFFAESIKETVEDEEEVYF